jgi:hypothetical protein
MRLGGDLRRGLPASAELATLASLEEDTLAPVLTRATMAPAAVPAPPPPVSWGLAASRAEPGVLPPAQAQYWASYS